jgi:hypothetical protein
MEGCDMSGKEGDQERLPAEFRRFGENLVRALEAAWESDDRKKLTREIEEGMKAFGAAVEETAKGLADSPTARKARKDIEEFSERVQSGETAQEVREGILKTLKRINEDLEAAAVRWKDASEEGERDA